MLIRYLFLYFQTYGFKAVFANERNILFLRRALQALIKTDTPITEEWLRKAIDELDKRKMTPDERLAYERTLAINAESIRVAKEAVQKARNKDKRAVERMLKQGKLSIEEIADSLEVSPEFVRSIASSPN